MHKAEPRTRGVEQLATHAVIAFSASLYGCAAFSLSTHPEGTSFPGTRDFLFTATDALRLTASYYLAQILESHFCLNPDFPNASSMSASTTVNAPLEPSMMCRVPRWASIQLLASISEHMPGCCDANDSGFLAAMNQGTCLVGKSGVKQPDLLRSPPCCPLLARRFSLQSSQCSPSTRSIAILQAE